MAAQSALNPVFLMILIKAPLEEPLFYAGALSVVIALTLQKRLAIPLRTIYTAQKPFQNGQGGQLFC